MSSTTDLDDDNLIILIKAYLQGSITGRQKAVELGVRQTSTDSLAAATATEFTKSGSPLELETWLSATYLDKKKTNSVTEINDQLWAGRSFFYSAFNNSFGQGEKYEKSEFLNTYITKDSSELSDLLQQLPNPTDALRTSYEDLLGYIENNYRAARDEKSKYLVTKGDLENRLNRFDTILNDDLGLIWPIRMGFKEGEDFFDQYDKKGKWISWILNKRVNKYASTMEKDKVAEKGIKRGMVNLYLASRDIAEMYNVPTANIK